MQADNPTHDNDDCISAGDDGTTVHMNNYTYDLGGLAKGPSGYMSSGQGGYIWHLDVGQEMSSLPQPSCSGAKGECDDSGCSVYQTSLDGSSCYAIGDVDSLSATFYDPVAGSAGRPEDGLTLVMSTGGGCMYGKRWTFVRLICGDDSDPGNSAEVPGMVCVYEVWWTHSAGCPITPSFPRPDAYTISHGMQTSLRGQYTRMGTSRSCNDEPIYHKGHHYLYQPQSDSVGWWVVGSEDSMNSCANTASLYSVGGCADDPSGSGCAGKWKAHTGSATQYSECDDPDWCTEPGLTVTAGAATMESMVMNATAVTLGDPLTDAACYEISGGFTKVMGVSGQYQRMIGGSTATNPVCGGKSIWKNGDSYIYSNLTNLYGLVWCVGNAAQMGACTCVWDGASDTGAYLTNGDGQGQSPDTNTGHWWAHTGQGTSYGQCDDSSKQGNSGWCGDAGIKVVAC